MDMSEKNRTILTMLSGYKAEAKENRKSGPHARDPVWSENTDLYWGRYDNSGKASWQAQEVMPEVASYVDRFAAAMKEAMVATPNGFYTITDPSAAGESSTADAIKRVSDEWLSSVGYNALGSITDFPTVFEDQMKMGALKSMATVTNWKTDMPGGRVAIETVDPSTVWLDHTNRSLYRMREIELDRVDVIRMAEQKDSAGHDLFNRDEFERLAGKWSSQADDIRRAREEMSGVSQETRSSRDTVVMTEYVASIVGPDGKMLADRELMVTLDDEFLIRGPEKNPFWHGNDWLLMAPLISVPLSPYGKTYVEDFADVAKIFNKMTNLLLDATAAASMNAYVMVPQMLVNPADASGPVTPNKRYLIQDNFRAEDFIREIKLGSIDGTSMQMWSQMKSELTEGAKQNEIGLGQLAPNGRTSATEIASTQQSSSAVLRGIASTVEQRYLSPQLNLTWRTGIQHAKANDKRMRRVAGDEMWDAMVANKREFASKPYLFRADGISMLIQKQQTLQQLMQLVQIIAGNPQLLQAFMARVDVNRFLDLLFSLSNIDISKLSVTNREQLVQNAIGPVNAAASGAQSPGAGVEGEMGDAMQRLGIGRQM